MGSPGVRSDTNIFHPKLLLFRLLASDAEGWFRGYWTVHRDAAENAQNTDFPAKSAAENAQNCFGAAESPRFGGR
jgi:hypothetical protein